MAYVDFKNEWTGRRVDYDHVYGYQCVDLITQYVKECFGLPTGVYGNAIDYWYKPTPTLLTKFEKTSGTNANTGDIVILNGLPGNPYGHIGICDHQDASGIWLLEQNGWTGNGSGTGGDAIGIHRATSTSRLAGILKPIGGLPPTPSPASGTAQAIRQTYVRVSPSTSAALGGSHILNAGDTFKYTGKVAGENVNQNGVSTNIWYHSAMGNYVWSGNCKDI